MLKRKKQPAGSFSCGLLFALLEAFHTVEPVNDGG